METEKKYPFLRREDGKADLFLSNGYKSIYIFPNPKNSEKLQSFWISTYSYENNNVIDQRVVSRPTLDAFITSTFYN